MADRIQIYTVHTEPFVVNSMSRLSRPVVPTQDSRLEIRHSQDSRLNQGSRLKAEGPASKTGHLRNSPTPPTRTTPAERVGCFCRSLLLLVVVVVAAAAAAAAAGAGYTMVFDVQSPLLSYVLPRYSAAWCSTDGTARLRLPLAPWDPGVLVAVARYILISRLISKPHCQLIIA